MNKFLSILLIVVGSLLACKSSQPIQNTTNSKASTIIDKAIVAHGGEEYLTSAFAFDFRNKQYTFKNNNQSFLYTRQEVKDHIVIKDELSETGLTRHLDGQLTTLSTKDSTNYSNSLNSVIYFALLPYKLNDSAVLKDYKGLTTLKGKSYHTIEITFKQQGGGTDFEDVFYYWISQDTHIIDYLAYQFHVNGGGVRFREAVSPKVVDGIRFQDYVNYKADKDTPLATLPILFESGELKKLSVIELENIRALKN